MDPNKFSDFFSGTKILVTERIKKISLSNLIKWKLVRCGVSKPILTVSFSPFFQKVKIFWAIQYEVDSSVCM